MEQLLLRIFSTLTLICILSSAALAQDTKPATKDTVKAEINTGFQLYIDYGKLITVPTDFETKLEGGFAYRFKNRLSPNLQIGSAKLQPAQAIQNGEYTVEGQYFRVGLDYLLPIDNENLLYIGAKYGASRYEEAGHYMIASDLWDTYENSFSRTGLKANWLEIIIGSEKQLSPVFIAGGYFTLRALLSRDEFEPIDTYAIPGYGRAFDNTTPALNFYIALNL